MLRHATRVGWAACWLIVGGLAAFTAVRVAQPGDSALVIGVAALTPWPYFLAWPVLGVSITRRRWLMAAGSALLIVAQVSLVLPSWRPDVTAAPAAGAWRLRVFDANVLDTNSDLTGIAAEIEADHPDVVALQELTTANVNSLRQTGAVSGYRWHRIDLVGGSTGFGVWSDVPLADPRTWYAGRHPEFSAELRQADGTRVTLLVVHTFAPHGADEPAEWSAELHAIAERVATAVEPLVVVGDFNATADMKQFQALLHEGLVDAAVARGQGWRMTWPRDLPVVPPFLRPDHLLYSRGLTATAYRLGTGSGSDHRPLLVELAHAAAPSGSAS
jgi:endonuclease/exonuclease/phosphatase (EEP) superfamily protein YafD